VPEQVVIDPRFCGPPDSGHGGYSCSLVGERIDGAAEVSLRLPPPIGKPLSLERRDDGTVVLTDGDALVAEGAPAQLDDVDVPEPVSVAQAVEASRRFFGFHSEHPFPGCFVCGPGRAPGDGLRIFAGQVSGRPDLFAAPWTPDELLGGDDGLVRPEFVWSALDCPTGNALAGALESARPVLLARLAVEVSGPVPVGEPHVLVSWRRGSEGRKHHSAAALFSADGAVRGVSRALWIELRDPATSEPAG